jgi:RNA polymerase sporulation-specific sigma factor
VTKTNTQLLIEQATPILTEEEERCLFLNLTEEARDRIVTSNILLVVHIAQRWNCPGLTTDDFIGEGLKVLVHAVKHFDTSRGVKFSTYLHRIVSLAFGRIAREERASNKGRMCLSDKYQDERDPMLSVEDVPREDSKTEVTDLLEVLKKNTAWLTRQEQFVVKSYYGIGTNSLSLEQIGNLLNPKVTRERVRQIRNKALDRLREKLR